MRNNGLHCDRQQALWTFRQSRPRLPSSYLTGGLAAGILVDRFATISLAIWLWIAVCCVIVAIAATVRRAPRGLIVSALLAVISLGGARHHLFWHFRSENNIRQFAAEEPRTVKVRGTIASSISLRTTEHSSRVPAWMQIDHSICVLNAEHVADGSTWISVSGALRLDVQGHLLHVRPGDRVEVVGHLSLPSPPDNPGDFDFRLWMQHHGLDALLRAEHPVCVIFREELTSWRWQITRQRATLRTRCESILVAHLEGRQRAIARSLLLGDRSEMTDELRENFMQSGTMHLLAVSGLHVGILLTIILYGCRGLNIPRLHTTALLLVIGLCYVAVTDQQPSVLRAMLLAAISMTGYIFHRTAGGLNSLMICLAILLLWNPATLFDVGAQLSFLAVAVIIVVHSSLASRAEPSPAGEVPVEEHFLWHWLRPLGRHLYTLYIVSAAIWIITAPLTIWHFHLLSPVGLLVNVLLIPYTSVVLFLGFSLIACGVLLPVLTPFVATCFSFSLALLLGVVDWSGQVNYGHFHSPTIPAWWTVGFYIFILYMAAQWQRRQSFRRGLMLTLMWIIVGLLIPLHSHRQDELTITFLAVGHGNATVIELPGDRVIIYDAGTLGDGRRAADKVERYLWQRGRQRIDAVIVSHADVDHFNGVTSLLKTASVGTILIGQQFLDFKQEAVHDLCNAASTSGVPLRIAQAGDQLTLPTGELSNSTCQLDILHPLAGVRHAQDNANSVVLKITYAEKVILLTGDLDGAGLETVLQQQIGPVDILAAPHHGAKSSNPKHLYTTLRPKYIIASSGNPGVTQRLRQVAGGDSEIYSTHDTGAVTVTISAAGEVDVSTYGRSMNSEVSRSTPPETSQ